MRIAIDDPASISEAAAAVDQQYGRLDALVNCGGATTPVPANDLDGLTDDIFDRTVTINLRGPFAMVRAFRPLLERGSGAAIVNISSIAARTGLGSSLAYLAAKAGVDALTIALAKVLAPKIRVFSVSPAGVDTDFVPGRTREQLAENRRKAAARPRHHAGRCRKGGGRLHRQPDQFDGNCGAGGRGQAPLEIHRRRSAAPRRGQETMEKLKFYIDGAWVDPATPSTLGIVNPATEEIFAQISLGSRHDVDRAATAARRAFATYSETSVERASVLASEDHRGLQGAPARTGADDDARNGRAHHLRDRAPGDRRAVSFRGSRARARTLPVRRADGGRDRPPRADRRLRTDHAVELAAEPGGLQGRAGACDRLHRRPETQRDRAAQRDAVCGDRPRRRASRPGVFNLVNGDGPTVGEAIAAHPEIDMVSFTGSTTAGVRVAKLAADTVKRVAQELGGKSANIILADADLKAAVIAGRSRLLHQRRPELPVSHAHAGPSRAAGRGIRGCARGCRHHSPGRSARSGVHDGAAGEPGAV